jgi:hypothetical protein
MHPILRNILATVFALFVGGLANMTLIQLSGVLFPIEGLDPNNIDSIKEAMKSMPLTNFFMTWLAHALGTFVAAFLVTKLAANNQKNLAIICSLIFLSGGIMMVLQVGGPLWFIIADLALAYVPMAYLGWTLAGKGN